jgi:cytochrome b561
VQRYDRAARTLHWLIAILFLAATGLALFRETFARHAVAMISLHKLAGLTILLLVAARIALRLRRPAPPPVAGRRWERRLARSVHLLMYALLLLVPLAGWVFVSYAPESRPLDYRGGASVPELPLRPDDDSSFAWHEVHEIAGFALIFLFALHLAAVARHQLRPGDAVLPRMTGGGRAELLPWLALAATGLWAAGLALDFLGVRLVG